MKKGQWIHHLTIRDTFLRTDHSSRACQSNSLDYWNIHPTCPEYKLEPAVHVYGLSLYVSFSHKVWHWKGSVCNCFKKCELIFMSFQQVILYRSGLVTAAASFVIAGASAFLPEHTFLRDIVGQDIDLFYMLGAGGLGLSLFLIHIYVTPIKRTLQALWAIGVLGSLGTYLNLAQPANETLTQYVVINPVAVWFVGPLFAALTGLVFKEGKRHQNFHLLYCS